MNRMRVISGICTLVLLSLSACGADKTGPQLEAVGQKANSLPEIPAQAAARVTRKVPGYDRFFTESLNSIKCPDFAREPIHPPSAEEADSVGRDLEFTIVPKPLEIVAADDGRGQVMRSSGTRTYGFVNPAGHKAVYPPQSPPPGVARITLDHDFGITIMSVSPGDFTTFPAVFEGDPTDRWSSLTGVVARIELCGMTIFVTDYQDLFKEETIPGGIAMREKLGVMPTFRASLGGSSWVVAYGYHATLKQVVQLLVGARVDVSTELVPLDKRVPNFDSLLEPQGVGQ